MTHKTGKRNVFCYRFTSNCCRWQQNGIYSIACRLGLL